LLQATMGNKAINKMAILFIFKINFMVIKNRL
jgi:hypothetical protein